jgi:hypothetical protein
MAKELKERLLTTIEEIPESKLGELLDFMQFLLEKERRKKERKLPFDLTKDPILEFIGGVSHGSLAKDIDIELYGEQG